MSQLLSQARSKRRRVDPGTVYVSGDQGSGGRIADVGSVKLRGKRFDPYKILRSNIKHFSCSLGLRRDAQRHDQAVVANYPPSNAALYSKYMASEFNPGRAGCVPVVYDSNPGSATTDGVGILPMHIIDLNTCPLMASNAWPASGAVEDCRVTFPVKATTQCEDINSRFWIWSSDHYYGAGGGVNGAMRRGLWRTIPNQFTSANAANEVSCRPRWTWDESTERLSVTEKVYKRSIDVRMNLYGCNRLQTKFDIRVIRFIDPEMAPDYHEDLPAGNTLAGNTAGNTAPEDKLTLFRDRWYSMVKPFVSNPLLKGLDRQDYPSLNKRWFTTVYKKKVEIAEVAGAGVDGGPPCATLSFSIPINELQDLAWDARNIKDKSTSALAYDETPGANVPFVEQEVTELTVPFDATLTRNVYLPPTSTVQNTTSDNTYKNIHVKPHPKSRLYLLIRALAPMDNRSTAGNTDLEEGNYTGGVNWTAPSTEGGFFHLDGLRPPFSKSAARWNDTIEDPNFQGTADAKTDANSLSYDYTPSYDLILRQHFTGVENTANSHVLI